MNRRLAGRWIGAALLMTSMAAAPARAQETPQPGVSSLSLEEAVQRALEENRELAVARLGLDAANAQVREAWSSVYPVLNATSSYTRNLDVPVNYLPAVFFDSTAAQDELRPVRFGFDNDWYGQVQLNQPLFNGAAFIGVSAAGRFRELQEEMVRGRAQSVVTRTRQSYYDVLLARESARLSDESVRRVRETLREMRAMQRAGLAGEYDVLRLEVELGNLEPNLQRARNAADAAARALAVQLGMDADWEIVVSGALSEIDFDGEGHELLRFSGLDGTVVADEAIQMAMERRSDLRQARLTETLRLAELRAEQSEYLPKVFLFANYSLIGRGNGSPTFFGDGDPASSSAVGLQVSVPLFSGFRRPARVDQKQAALQQARTQTRLAEEQVTNQVRTLVDQVEESRTRTLAQRRAVMQARRGYEIAHARFREGTASRLELTDAEVALRQSEFNYAQAVYDFLTTRARLDEAVGVVPRVDD